MAEDLNPHHICTWDNESDCKNCKIEGELHCKWDGSVLGAFMAISIPASLITIFMMVVIGLMTGGWWPLVAYIAYIIVVFIIVENKALCSHCPYYSQETAFLKCLGNNGFPRIWKYNPKPINALERFWFWGPTVAGTFLVWPLAVMAYGIWLMSANSAQYGQIALVSFILLGVSNLLASVAFYVALRAFFCSQCVNFSCQFNTVAKELVDAYLEKNPVMREAWEKTGYKLG